MIRSQNPRAAIATIYTEGLFGRLAFSMVSFAMPLYAAALGLSLAQIGVLISVRTIFVLPFKPIAGWLADRVGTRKVYLASITARTLSALVLFFAGDFWSLMAVRLLQGASSAGRDVVSLGVIAREAQSRVGSRFGWYSSAKHIGNLAGAGAAGLLIAAFGGRFDPDNYRVLWIIVLDLSLIPLVVAWFGLREIRSPVTGDAGPVAPTGKPRGSLLGRLRSGFGVNMQGLWGAASVGMLVAASAYMVHGLFPVLATEYAGLSEAQAGVIYSASGLAFVVAAPTFGWLIDRRGRSLGLAIRSLCNIGSSVLYVAFPSAAGVAAARVVDDSGKAAFVPAWASLVAEISREDPARSGRKIGTLDTAATVGEAVGPALATLLWQTGGIVLLFAVRIGISICAEVAAFRVFGDLHNSRFAWLRGRREREA